MNKRLISGFLMLSLLVLAGHAAMKEVPMKGRGAGQITGMGPGPTSDTVAITAAGGGEATHLGKFTREESIVLNPVTGALSGTVTFVAADGSELYCSFSGGFTGPGVGGGTYTWTGGTGRLSGVSGQAAFTIAQTDPVNFTFEFAGGIDLN